MIYKVVATLALAATGAWVAARPGWDSICAAFAALAALAAGFLPKPKAESGQSQNIGEGSVGIQAGRDANVSDVTNKVR